MRKTGTVGLSMRWLGMAAVALGLSSVALEAGDESRIARMTEEGAQPRTGTFSVLPWESIDMLSGNGVLTWTDVALPGNAGLDLRVQRVLNLNTRQWRIGVPGPAAVVLEIGGSLPVENPIIEYLDGGREYTFRAIDDADLYYTLSYGRFHKSTRTLELPNGLVYRFEHSQGASTWRVTSVADSFGNTITFAYDGTTTTIGHDFGEQARTVVIRQPLGGDWTVSFNGRTWTYRFTGTPGWLSVAEQPDGLQWQHTLTALPAGSPYPLGGHLVEVTTPHGGTVRYTVRRWSGAAGGDERHTVWLRESFDRGVPSGLWRFRYDTLALPHTSYVSGPDEVLHTYSHHACEDADFYANRIVLTTHTVSRGSLSETGSVTIVEDLQTTGYVWSCRSSEAAIVDKVGGDLPLPTADAQAPVP